MGVLTSLIRIDNGYSTKDIIKIHDEIMWNHDNTEYCFTLDDLDKSWYEMYTLMDGLGRYFSNFKSEFRNISHSDCDLKYINHRNILIVLNSFRISTKKTFANILKEKFDYKIIDITYLNKRYKIISSEDLKEIFDKLKTIAKEYSESNEWYCDWGDMKDYYTYYLGHYQNYIKFLTDSVYVKDKDEIIFIDKSVILTSC